MVLRNLGHLLTLFLN